MFMYLPFTKEPTWQNVLLETISEIKVWSNIFSRKVVQQNNKIKTEERKKTQYIFQSIQNLK